MFFSLKQIRETIYTFWLEDWTHLYPTLLLVDKGLTPAILITNVDF